MSAEPARGAGQEAAGADAGTGGAMADAGRSAQDAPAPSAMSAEAADAGAAGPSERAPAAEPSPTEGEHALAQTESGGDQSEDAAPEGIISRASGRPDHPRSLEEIVKSGYIRVLTRNNDTSFFIYRGHRMGFDYEIGKRLAQHLNIRVDMIITNTWNEMWSSLQKGEGDVIAAEVTVTPERQKQVLFAEPWGKTKEVVVWKDGTTPIRRIEDLAGKEVHVRRSSTYFDSLAALNQKLKAEGKPEVIVKPVPEDWETDTILQNLSRGELVYTVADSILADIHTAYFQNLVIGPAISDERDLAWAVRTGDDKLRKTVDQVFHELRKKPDFNMMRTRYFEAQRSLKKERTDKFYASETGTLSPYDPIVRKYAEQHEFDWRLVAAQIYQESHFDPTRKSWVGATGLFQIMPATARGLGIVDATDPEQSIRGGLKYMQQLSDHYKDVADPIERYRFALAAYNSGFGHVDDARRLARGEGKDAARWREVAAYLLKLADKKVAAKTRFGYCRGSEPVEYVRHIDERYTGYLQLVQLRQNKP